MSIYLVVGAVAFGASLLTLFSGFGLGSLLVATLVVFFPVEVAISATAVVHLFSNLLKVSLFYRKAVLRVIVRFGIPAVIAAFAVLDLARRAGSGRMDERWLPIGGALSGFFGGLSGHQGAFRAAVLSRLDFEPEAYVGTQAVLARMEKRGWLCSERDENGGFRDPKRPF